MQNIRDLNVEEYPELDLFLSAMDNIQDLSFLQKEYEFMDDHGAEKRYSILEICAVFGKVEHLNALINYFDFDPVTYQSAFVESVNILNLDVSVRLLEFETILDRFEADNEYVDYVLAKIRDLAIRRRDFVPRFQGDVFDIDPNELSTVQVILRNLIRRNSIELHPVFTSLLELPRLTQMSQSAGRELLYITRDSGDHQISLALLRLPNLAGLEEEFMEEETQLREIAEDRESSIRALTPSEKRMLDTLEANYGGKLTKEAELNHLKLFKATLQERYESKPAKVKLSAEETLDLPFTREEFEKLELEGEELKQALQAYFQHPDHTAHRYLSKPNHWIDPEAEFTKKDPNHPEWGSYADSQRSPQIF